MEFILVVFVLSLTEKSIKKSWDVLKNINEATEQAQDKKRSTNFNDFNIFKALPRESIDCSFK